MARRRWEGVASFKTLSGAEKEQVRNALNLTPHVNVAAPGGNPSFKSSNVEYFDFTEITAPSDPASNHLRLWAEDNNGFSVLHWADATSLDHEIGRDLVHVVRNSSGGTIAMGEVVYVSGSTGTVPNVAKARANSATTMPAYGLAVEAISNNSFGRIMTAGDIQGLDTSGFSAGDILYVSAATAGAVTATEPTGTSIDQRIGVVLRSHATQGVIGITIGSEINPGLTQTLTNKTINLLSNTLSGTAAEFDTACSDDNFLYASDIGTSVHAAMTQQGAIADPSGGATQDAEARTAIGSILTALRNLGLIAT